jgi:hydrogenase small subunit
MIGKAMKLVGSKRGTIPLDSSPISGFEVLWITVGLVCDGDTVAVAAAAQPSIEGSVLGAFHGMPEDNLHSPFLADENGDEFVRSFRDAAEGNLSPFVW